MEQCSPGSALLIHMPHKEKHVRSLQTVNLFRKVSRSRWAQQEKQAAQAHLAATAAAKQEPKLLFGRGARRDSHSGAKPELLFAPGGQKDRQLAPASVAFAFAPSRNRRLLRGSKRADYA